MILTPKENFDKFYEEHIKFLQREKKRIEDFFREDGISGEYLTDQIEGIGNIIKEFTKGQGWEISMFWIYWISYRKEANGALNYFNNTFIFTSRITVEHSKPVCDPALPRPWSAHSVGSSKYQKNHFQKSDLPNKNNLIVENDSNESNDLTKNKIDKLFNDELSKESSVSDMNKLDQMKSMTSHNETDVNKSGKPTEVPPEEPLMKLVHIPLDKKTKNQKGFAYVLYHIPEHVVKAYIELDNKFFMGRLLRILPSKDELQIRDLDPSKWSLNE
ncbi:5933_t:CDS:2, partial [Gigaspora rosea]